MNHDIFISYSSKQKSIADGVCHYLEENGFKCWMAPRDIPIGSEYGDLIEEAIKVSKAVVLVFSEAASISKWVKGEINVAFTEDKPILPFRVDETEVKGGFRVMLNMMHWIDAFPQYADRLPDLLNSVCGFLGRQPQKVSDERERLETDRKAKEEAERERLGREQKTKLANGHEYVDLGLPSGTLWATCNLGANKPEEYGDYFAWGEIHPKTKYGWGTYKYSKTKKRLFKTEELITKYCGEVEFGYDGFTDGLAELQASDDAAAANWGNGWYTPKREQWDELMANTNSEWTTRNGVEGRLFTSKKNGQTLFLPAAGNRWESELNNAGSFGYYWSSSLRTSCPDYAWYFYFRSGRTGVYGSHRGYGRSVRAVRPARQN